MAEARQYRLVLRSTARGPSLQLRVSTPEAREATLVRVGGGGVKELFEAMVDVLKRHGYVEAEAKTAVMTAYRIKPEIGPVVGGYIILVRRARDPSAWKPLFEAFVTEKYVGAKTVLSHLLSLSEDLSKISPPPKRVRMKLNPKILDGVSAGVKVLARKLWGLRKL
ncbi:MAG: hypothetical protein ACK4H7_01965 [Acidilobaceae archaeon]